MADPLFDRHLPERLANQGATIDMTLKLGQLRRIADVVAKELAGHEANKILEDWRDSPVTIKLAFGWADQRESVVVSQGEVTTCVPAICQRCLKPFALHLWASLDLVYAGVEDDVDGDGGLEVWELDEELLRPLDVVEEALVLAIPFAPMHQEARHCEPLAQAGKMEEADMQSPFAGLREQMQDKN